MPIKSHLLRSLDPRLPSNLALIALVVVAAGVAMLLWLNGAPAAVLLAPVHVFLSWALLREIDPDHPYTAQVGGAIAGTWVLTGGETVSAFAVVGLMTGARLITASTGRRPLTLDLWVVALVGIAIGFSVEGWVAGFGVAVAIYVDHRLGEVDRPLAVPLSALAALGTTIVASLTDTFPRVVPDVIPYMTAAAGVAALLLLSRDPVEPTSRVDARHASLLDHARLQASRSLTAVLVFVMTILTGAEAKGMVPLIAALTLAVVSNELELVRRRTR